MMAAAYHEAGHAVAAHTLGAVLGNVIINADGSGEMNYITRGPCSLRTAWGRFRAKRWIVVAYCGPEAELRFVGGDVTAIDGCGADLEMAYALAKRLGLNADERNHLVGVSVRLVEARWRAIEIVARALIERSQLTGGEIAELIRRRRVNISDAPGPALSAI
jgi:hypothetical protein